MQIPDNIPPQNIEAEQSILSACLISPEAMTEAADFVKPSHFYRQSHQKIFQIMLDLVHKKQPVDLVMLTNSLNDKKILEEIGGASYLSRIVDAVPMAVNVEHYCNIVKACAIKRQLIEQCNAIVKSCFDSPNGAVQVLDDAQKRISGISIDVKDNVQKFSDTVLEATDRYAEAREKQGEITGIPTGYSYLDYLTCGWQSSNLIIVAGRPSMGKSALTWCFAETAARKGSPVLIFSLEMACEEYTDRAYAKCSQVNSQKFRSGRFEGDDWEKISNAGTQLYNLPIWIDDTPAVDHNYIRRVSRIYQQRHKIKFVIIDHLQLMRGDKAPTRDREIASITSGLKAMAKELKIPVILVSQLNRALEQRPISDRRPRLSDLRDSGNIEQDADLVAFLYRDAVYNDEISEVKKNIAELDLKKQRNGPTGMVKMYWNDRITTFFDLKEDS